MDFFSQICEYFDKVAKKCRVFHFLKTIPVPQERKILDIFVFFKLFGSATSDIFSKYWKVLVSNHFKICESASSATEDEAALSLAQVSSSRKLEVKRGLTQFWKKK